MSWFEDHFWNPINEFGRKVFGDTEWYIGYNSNNGWNASINTNTQKQGIPNTKPPAYSRVSAATAKDIAQGGMTKDEVKEFNMKHPNETALRG